MAQASAEKLEHTGPAKKERVASVPQREQLASMPERLLPKGKGTNRLSKAPDHEEGESQGEREPHLGKKEGDQSESIERNHDFFVSKKASFRLPVLLARMLPLDRPYQLQTSLNL